MCSTLNKLFKNLLYYRWKVGKWGPCRACKNLSGLRAREVECVRENPKIGAEDILVEDEECDDVRPASKELCNSPKKCKVREAEQMPQEMAQEIWRQINKRKIQNRRDLVSLFFYLTSRKKNIPLIF